MTPEVLKKAFEPLFSIKGFGIRLGMPTVKQIVEQHSSGVEGSSEPGHGTIVVLWLPVENLKAGAA
jgi:signal transduction histidine kinase